MKNEETLPKKNILVIDPDQDFCKNMQIFLEDNYKVITRQELDYIDYTILLHKIDLLLIEAEYAGTDVLKLVQNLKNNHPNLKIMIMYTYFSSDKSTQKNLADFSDDMITKPFDAEFLREKIDALLIPKNFSLSESK